MNGMLIYIIDDAHFPYSEMPSAAVTLMLECVLIHLHSCFCALTRSELTPTVAHVATRREPGDGDGAMRLWPCHVRWGRQWYALASRDKSRPRRCRRWVRDRRRWPSRAG